MILNDMPLLAPTTLTVLAGTCSLSPYNHTTATLSIHLCSTLSSFSVHHADVLACGKVWHADRFLAPIFQPESGS